MIILKIIGCLFIAAVLLVAAVAAWVAVVFLLEILDPYTGSDL